jgi:hypothetical protein
MAGKYLMMCVSPTCVAIRTPLDNAQGSSAPLIYMGAHTLDMKSLPMRDARYPFLHLSSALV